VHAVELRVVGREAEQVLQRADNTRSLRLARSITFRTSLAFWAARSTAHANWDTVVSLSLAGASGLTTPRGDRELLRAAVNTHAEREVKVLSSAARTAGQALSAAVSGAGKVAHRT
jgi:hypothetical protein